MQHVSIEGMCGLVQDYIFDKTRQRVDIEIEAPVRYFPHHLAVSYLQKQLILLNHAYSVAEEYYSNKG